MLLCGFHWHSRYSIQISTFVSLHCVWFTGSSCAKWILYIHLVSLLVNGNWFTVTLINSTAHVHACFCIYLLVLWYVISTSEMALISSINPCHGTDACLHLHLEWYYVTNDSGVYFYFCCSVEASSPLKVLSFLWTLMNFNEFLWYSLNFMKPCDACGFFLNDNWIAMKNCTVRLINV